MDTRPVKEVINSFGFGNVLECEKEKYRNEEMSHIENGVFKIKIKYDLEKHERLLEQIGKSKINGQICLLQLVGHPPKCLSCNKFGHMSSACPNKSSTSNKSSYASIIVRPDSNYQDLEKNDQIISLETSDVASVYKEVPVSGEESSQMLKLGDATRYGHKRCLEELDESNTSVLDQKKTSKIEYEFELSATNSSASNIETDSEENSRMENESDSINELAAISYLTFIHITVRLRRLFLINFLLIWLNLILKSYS